MIDDQKEREAQSKHLLQLSNYDKILIYSQNSCDQNFAIPSLQ